MKNIESEIKSINSSTLELVEEAKTLFSMFDAISASICKFEKDMNDLRAYLPFKFKTLSENDLSKKPAENYHKNTGYDVIGYRTTKDWLLSWEPDDNSKNFRLFIIAEEREIIYYTIPGEDPAGCGEAEYLTKTILKKPLMQTSLPIRVQHYHYLVNFIDSFKSYLNEHRVAIENGNIFEDIHNI